MAERAPDLDGIIRRFCDELERAGVHPERLLLFGSHARGEARDGSDIDLIVISRDWHPLCRRERLELLGVAAARILEPVQAHGLTPEEIASHDTGPFLQGILESQAVEMRPA